MPKDRGVFGDRDVRMELLAMVVYSREWLRQCGEMVRQDDFLPLAAEGQERVGWVVAGLALEFWRRYREPLASLVRREVEKWMRTARVGDKKRQEVMEWLRLLRISYKPGRTEVLVEEVVEFKKTRARRRALRELTELEVQGKLTDDIWLENMRLAIEGFVKLGKATDPLADLEARTERRSMQQRTRFPMFLIDPLDGLIKGIGRGHLGLWLAAYKMGKSLALLNTAVNYLIQGLNVLFVTLEDPKQDVEDRLDAHIAHLPIEELGWEGPRIRKRVERFKNMLRSRIKIVDGTDGGLSVMQIEQIWDRERTLGFEADATIIDYDDELRATQKRQERRFEFADIYRDLRKFAARRQQFVWTGAQAGRRSEGEKIVSAGMVAEDISKVRKVTLCLGIGQGDWGEDSRYLNVAVHRNDRMRVGTHIWSNPAKAQFYDRQRTLQWLAREREQRREKENSGKEEG